MKPEDVLIIGAGPAGITAAIQLKRYGIPFLLLEMERVGGLLWNANLVENYPGFPAGVSGSKLVGLMTKQMERIGVQVTFDTVKKLDYEDGAFLVETSRNLYHPRYVVVASGTQPKPIPLAIPESVRGKVLSEVYPLLTEREKQVVIIGAGDAAFDYALNLAKNRNSVTILNRDVEVKCLQLLWERAQAESLIEYCAEVSVGAIMFDEMTNRLEVQLEAGESLKADYLLFAIGRVPQVDFFSPSVREHENVLQAEGKLYFAGDVKNGLLRQTAISAGNGLRTAMQIYHSLKEDFT